MLNCLVGYDKLKLHFIDGRYGGCIIMALKQITMSRDIEQETDKYNEKSGWVRLYLNADNGYVWAEDTEDCPKANHTTYDRNKHIVVVFEKGKDGGDACCGCTVTAQEVVNKCNELLASL